MSAREKDPLFYYLSDIVIVLYRYQKWYCKDDQTRFWFLNEIDKLDKIRWQCLLNQKNQNTYTPPEEWDKESTDLLKKMAINHL